MDKFKSFVIFFSAFSFLSFSIWVIGSNATQSHPIRGNNLRPIIGILSQEIFDRQTNSSNVSYIAASYVKYIEGSGAQVVPIMINQTEEYYKFIFHRINGLLFPGGGVLFNEPGGYGAAGKTLLNLAKNANLLGDYFPVWGTCLGFEFLLYQAANETDDLKVPCSSYNVLDRLKFTKEMVNSTLFGNAPKSIIQALSTKKVAANFHHWCITPETFAKYNVDKTYKALSLNYDSQSNLTFISTVESVTFPFFGVQFHPEKNLYEWSERSKIPHSVEAVETAQYFANFFVNEARKNGHFFESFEVENNYTIYNHSPVFTGASSNFTQIYFFPIKNYF